MRKFLLYLITFGILTCSPPRKSSAYELYAPYQIPIDDSLKPYFHIIVQTYRKAGIKIDYSKIKSIRVIDSLKPETSDLLPRSKRAKISYEGLYNSKTKRLYVNTRQVEAYIRGLYDKKIIAILAHEVAHSQNIGHNSDPFSLMFPNSTYTYHLLNTVSLDSLIVRIYHDPVLLSKSLLNSGN